MSWSPLRLVRAALAATTGRQSDVGLVIAPMKRRHVVEVIAIENSVFSQPWSERLYLSELSIPDTRLYFVALENDRVIGYVGEMLIVDEAHITTLAVDGDHQGKNIGKALLYFALASAIDRGAKAATLEVRVSNRGAQSLYHQFGFVPAGIRKNYYAEEHEDGLVMWAYDLPSPEITQRMAVIRDALRARGLPLPDGISIDGAR